MSSVQSQSFEHNPKADQDPHPELLISVRSRDEFAIAVESNVNIVDLKEPRAGALAPSNRDLWDHAAKTFRELENPHSILLSAALGEQTIAVRTASQLPLAFAFAKAGPSGCDSEAQLSNLWRGVRQQLAQPIELVAVAYADHANAKCLDAKSIFRLAKKLGFRRCLIDTFRKDGRSTLDHLGLPGISKLEDFARRSNLWWAIAGSIKSNCVETLSHSNIHPDCYGVRGDVCDDGRKGTLQRDRIQTWKQALARQSASDLNRRSAGEP